MMGRPKPVGAWKGFSSRPMRSKARIESGTVFCSGGRNADFFAEAIEAAWTGHEEKSAFADSILRAVAKRKAATVGPEDGHFASKIHVRFKGKARRP